MSQSLVQTGAEIVVSGGTSGTVTLNGVGAGNLLTASCINQSNGSATFSGSDGANTWLSAVSQGGVTLSQILYAANVAGGNTTVTITASGSINFSALLEEWSGTDAAPLVATDANADSVPGTAHQASVAGINAAAPCVALVAGSSGSNLGTRTPGAGYTLDTASAVRVLREYQIFAAAPANEHGAFASANSVKATAVIAAFKSASPVASGSASIVGGGCGGMIC